MNTMQCLFCGCFHALVLHIFVALILAKKPKTVTYFEDVQQTNASSDKSAVASSNFSASTAEIPPQITPSNQASAVQVGDRSMAALMENLLFTKKIGEACSSNDECKAAFSICRDGNCRCSSGFKASQTDEYVCMPSVYTCPWGDPIKEESGAGVLKCERSPVKKDFDNVDCISPFTPMVVPPDAVLCPRHHRQHRQHRRRQRISNRQIRQSPPFPPMSPVSEPFLAAPMAIHEPRFPFHQHPLEWNDTCPENNFCNVHNHNEEPSGPGANGSGHCCPTPAPYCPIGKPHPRAKCSTRGMHKQPRPGDLCSMTTHYCHRILIGEQEIAKFCCPKPCKEEAIFRDGKCFARKLLKDACEIPDQCPSNADCVDGKCVCKKGFVNSNGGNQLCEEPYCPSDRETLTALTDANGAFLTCSSNSSCSSGSYCNPNYRACCPVPEAYCPDTLSIVSEVERCEVNAEEGYLCGNGKYCKYWYTTIDAAAGNSTESTTDTSELTVGLCCPTLGGQPETTMSGDPIPKGAIRYPILPG